MITAMGQLRMDQSRSRRLSSVTSRANSRHENQDRAGSNAVRTAITRSDRPLRPTFLPRQNEEMIPEQPEVETHITDDVMAAYVDYMTLPEQVRVLMNLNQFMDQQKEKARYLMNRQDGRTRGQGRLGAQPVEYKDALNKISLPIFDGSGQMSARSWIHKLDTFLSLKPMEEDKAIQFATMHLEGVAYDWWHHGLVSQDHVLIHSYEEFVNKLIARFDRKDVEVYYREMAQLK